jgi:hypothetical protein
MISSFGIPLSSATYEKMFTNQCTDNLRNGGQAVQEQSNQENEKIKEINQIKKMKKMKKMETAKKMNCIRKVKKIKKRKEMKKGRRKTHPLHQQSGDVVDGCVSKRPTMITTPWRIEWFRAARNEWHCDGWWILH